LQRAKQESSALEERIRTLQGAIQSANSSLEGSAAEVAALRSALRAKEAELEEVAARLEEERVQRKSENAAHEEVRSRELQAAQPSAELQVTFCYRRQLYPSHAEPAEQAQLHALTQRVEEAEQEAERGRKALGANEALEGELKRLAADCESKVRGLFLAATFSF
jgi:chromosome segregation ATPase